MHILPSSGAGQMQRSTPQHAPANTAHQPVANFLLNQLCTNWWKACMQEVHI
jgi:hypothetical protein